MRACTRDSNAFDWGELEAIYGRAPFAELVDRALAQMRADLTEFDRMLDAQAYSRAAQRLHRMKGTAAFFTCDEEALAALHTAERALALAEPRLVKRTLPAARRAIETLMQAFAARLTQR